jgi:5-methylcytosine-specific restriction endonuclease McrA
VTNETLLWCLRKIDQIKSYATCQNPASESLCKVLWPVCEGKMIECQIRDYKDYCDTHQQDASLCHFIKPLWKPHKIEPKKPKPIRQIGKVGKARQADRRRKLKAEPANHEGYRECYICQSLFEHVDLEHVIDASIRPDLRHDPENHKWACNPCNLKKKRGEL